MTRLNRYLAIETSSPRLSLALGTDTQILKEYQGPLAWRHAESLFEGMQKLLKQARWPVQSLTGVLVSTGPGSFTGIRIGLATARALGQSLKIPVAGISSLQTVGFSVLKPGKYACSIIDALRGEVFCAIYQMDEKGKSKTLLKECRMPWTDLLRKLKPLARQPLSCAGDMTLYRKDLLRIGGTSWQYSTPGNSYPQAGVLLKIGRPLLARAKSSSYESVLPLYLRSAAAVERRQPA